MSSLVKKRSLFAIATLLTGTISFAPVQAQPIVPAADGTGTIVTPSGNTFNINGGSISADKANLFHSFSEFGLNSGQIANFLSNPSIKNILSRVVGGDASIINGTLQVTGGNSHLFLINPAGFVFGSNASLNVPAAFTATTATSVGFGDNWFNATGTNNYAVLIGTPSTFAFSTSGTPGAIVNSGKLAVGDQQNLTLIGGTVLNTGTLTAPQGNITIAAVPHSSLIRISQPGHLLSLEIQPLLSANQPEPWTLPILSLPEMLAGKAVSNATKITVNDRGEIELTGGITLPPDITATTIISGNLNTSGETGGTVQVLGDKVGLIGANINANGINGGGMVFIGSDYQSREGLKAPSNSPTNSGYKPLNSSHTFISSDSYVSANAGVNGNGGRVIIWADKTTRIYGKIDARGGTNSGNGGFVETSGLHFLDISTVPDIKAPMGVGGEWLIDPSDISIVAGNGSSNINPLFPPFEPTGDSATIGVDLITTALAGGANVVVKTGSGGSQFGSISLNAPLDFKGTGTNTLTFDTTHNININQPLKNSSADSSSLNLILNADVDGIGGGNVIVNAAIATNGGNVTLRGADVILNNAINVGKGNITLQPSTATSTIGLGDGATGAFNLDTAALTTRLNSSGTVRIGRSDSVGTVDIRTLDLSNNNYNLLVNGGKINFGGQVTFADNKTAQFISTNIDSINKFSSSSSLIIGENWWSLSDATNQLGDGAFGSFEIKMRNVANGGSSISHTFIVPSGMPTPGKVTIIDPGKATPTPIPISTPTPTPIPTPIPTPTPTPISIPTSIYLPATNNTFKQPFSDSNNNITASRKVTLSNDIFVSPKEDKSVNSTTRSGLESMLSAGKIAQALPVMDTLYTKEYEDYFNRTFVSSKNPQSVAQIQNKLQAIAQTTGTKPVIIYIFTRTEQVDLVLVPPTGKPIYKSVPAAKRSALLQTVKEFKQQIGDPTKRRTTSYLPASRQLYQWIIAPLEPDLQKLEIDTLVFSMDAGLRTLPLAALHDDKQFLIEKYNLSLIPSFSLLDTRYTDIKNQPVLAMGMSKFADQMPLPAVPLELSTITNRLGRGQELLNTAFTIQNLQQQRQSKSFNIVHLATHAQFRPGEPSNSYIQLWERKLQLNEIQQLQLNEPPVELLVLSACRTALGDKQVELGWAGLAVQAGVKSALASLWYVKDAGTLALMSEFYNQLHKAPIKSEALRQAQIAILRGEVRLENGQLQGTFGQVALPPKLTALGNLDLKHPFYWAGYTMIGSPW